MSTTTLVDTGPLVALLRSSDNAHRRCVAQLRQFREPLVTCWPVLTEACWLLRSDVRQIRALFGYLTEQIVVIEELDAAAPARLVDFFARYSDHEPQLADAALMYLAERDEIETMFTLDRRDFSFYRTTDNRAMTIVPA